MTTTATNTIDQLIRKNTDPVMSGDVFYGTYKTIVKGKPCSVMVSNHLKEDKEYEFRVASKCQAGFVNISDWKTTPKQMISGFTKNSLVNIQVKITYESGRELWFNVYTTKGGKWYSIDKGFLDVLTVGDMRSSHPDMCDEELWKKMNTKTWADKAFARN
jgi:hypothetical protein